MGLDVGIRVCCCCRGGVRVGPEDDGVPAPNSSGTNLLLEAPPSQGSGLSEEFTSETPP